MKRTTLALMAGAIALSLVSGCAGGGSSNQTPGGGTASNAPIKIGALLSLTGTYAGLGAPEKNSLEMEVKRVNDAGGINGRPIDLVIEDDATDPKVAVAAVTKLIDKDKVVAILGATGTGSTMAIRSDADRAGIPLVSMAGGSVITATFDKDTFQTPWPNRLVVSFTIAALKKAGITKIGLISSSDGYGKDGHDVTVAQAKTSGIEIVADEVFNPGDTDMTTQLTKIKAKAPQAIWLWNAGKEAAIVAKNLRQIDPKATIKLYGAPGNARTEFITGAGDAAAGFRFAAGKILLPETYGAGTPAFTVATGFIDRYKAAYGTAPDIFAGHAYDALAITVDALKRAGDGADGPKLRDAIEQTKGLIGIGGTFTYTPTDHNGLTESDLVMYEIHNGAWELAK
jgi:branched-chain amino acid transport system substrate-binding protein